MKLAYKYGDDKELSDDDRIIMHYYAYLKINKGVTFNEFVNEQSDVVNTIFALKQIEVEEEEKQIKKAQRKNGK